MSKDDFPVPFDGLTGDVDPFWPKRNLKPSVLVGELRGFVKENLSHNVIENLGPIENDGTGIKENSRMGGLLITKESRKNPMPGLKVGEEEGPYTLPILKAPKNVKTSAKVID